MVCGLRSHFAHHGWLGLRGWVEEGSGVDARPIPFRHKGDQTASLEPYAYPPWEGVENSPISCLLYVISLEACSECWVSARRRMLGGGRGSVQRGWAERR